jgi:hypothetical protein
MQNQPVVRIYQVLGWNAFHQAGFDFIYVLSGGQTGTVADPEDVRVDCHDGFTKS